MARRYRNGVNSFWRDFQEFIARGNVVDLAIAVVIGGAFGKIVTSLVEDIIMPGLVNPIVGQTGSGWRDAVVGPGIKLGSFFGSIVDFLIIALVIFLVVRIFERLKRREEVAAPPPEPGPDPIIVQQQLAETLDRLTRALESRGL